MDHVGIRRAGWPVKLWCVESGVSRTTFYALADPPSSVTIGRKRIVTESPADYLRRVAGKAAESEAA